MNVRERERESELLEGVVCSSGSLYLRALELIHTLIGRKIFCLLFV